MIVQQFVEVCVNLHADMLVQLVVENYVRFVEISVLLLVMLPVHLLVLPSVLAVEEDARQHVETRVKDVKRLVRKVVEKSVLFVAINAPETVVARFVLVDVENLVQ